MKKSTQCSSTELEQKTVQKSQKFLKRELHKIEFFFVKARYY